VSALFEPSFRNEITINCDYFIFEYERSYTLLFNERSRSLSHILFGDEILSTHTETNMLVNQRQMRSKI
jgi:hypothetical protein